MGKQLTHSKDKRDTVTIYHGEQWMNVLRSTRVHLI
jgi:hypothetical protein